MKNFIQRGETITCPSAPYALTSGDPCKSSKAFGVATSTAAISTPVELQTKGVFDLLAVTADTANFGDLAYWDDTAKKITTTSNGNSLVGYFTKAKINTDTTARIRLNGVSLA